MKPKLYDEMTNKELENERIKLDKQIQNLRAEKKKIQDVIDFRYAPPTQSPGVHVIGGNNG